MSLKRLFFPIFIIITIFLGIFVVKPAILSVLAKIQERSDKSSELAVVEATKENLEVLSGSRESLLGTDEGKMVYGYLPISVDQDRVVDIFNYYAMQSGAVIDNAVFESKEGGKSPYFAEELPQGDDQSGSGIPVAPEPNSFTMKADIQGSYESVKAFLKEVSHPGRSYKLVSFSVEKKAAGFDSNGQPAADSGILTGKFVAEFHYLPEKRYSRGYLLPVFTAGQFDLGPIRDLMGKEKTVPALQDPGTVGRGNPFML